VYVVVVVGETIFDPSLTTSTPFKYTCSALLVSHVSEEDCPACIVMGNAVMLALTLSSPPLEPPLDTVTVALDETRWPSSTATSVYVFVALGETVFDPLLYT
jgi:hypothetical protein